jgi:hypothetical protein
MPYYSEVVINSSEKVGTCNMVARADIARHQQTVAGTRTKLFSTSSGRPPVLDEMLGMTLGANMPAFDWGTSVVI